MRCGFQLIAVEFCGSRAPSCCGEFEWTSGLRGSNDDQQHRDFVATGPRRSTWQRHRFRKGAAKPGCGPATHMLVCVGASLMMLISAFGFADVPSQADVILDPSRVAAQVASGIGFLGAGSILLRGEVVRGLTTAASLWSVAGIGLAVGSGNPPVQNLTAQLSAEPGHPHKIKFARAAV